MQGELSMRPRDYAADIAALSSLEERRAALQQVPEHWQELVKTHVRIFWALQRKRGQGERK